MMRSPFSLPPQQLRDCFQQQAKHLSLDISFSSPTIPLPDIHAFNHWLTQGYHGSMHYMADNQPLRQDPTQLVAGTLSIISARLNYWTAETNSLTQLSTPTSAYLSRYALGRDYHKVMRHKLKQLCLRVTEEIGEFHWRPFSDSAPILEHALARQAGLGFIGKHSLLIHPKAGSSFFLGEILCDLPLVADYTADQIKPSCGSCTQCMTLCPTQAISAPYQVDARRCISYLTIEHEGTIPLEFRSLIGNRIYGCDDCQLVCPWNKFAQMTTEVDFLPRNHLEKAELLTLWTWSEADFLRLTEGSPIRRIGYQRWRRNLAIALGNAPSDQRILAELKQALPLADEWVAEHISWAIEQQTQPNRQHQPPRIKRSFLP